MQAFDDRTRADYKAKIDTAAELREIRANEAQTRRDVAESLRIAAQSKADRIQARRELYERLTFGLYKAPRKYFAGRPVSRKEKRDNTAKIAAQVSAWKRCESGARFPHSYDGPTLMRLSGETVETSKHASFPVADCIALWPSIETAQRTATRSDNPDGLTMGTFPVSHISESGDVKASCHFITYAECRKLAIVLGLIQPTTAERFAHKARKLGKAFAIA